MSIKISLGEKEKQSRASSFFGGLICFLLSGTGFYFLFSDEELQGGIPFMPDVVNTTIGIFLVGFGAVLTGLLGVYAFYEFFRDEKI